MPSQADFDLALNQRNRAEQSLRELKFLFAAALLASPRGTIAIPRAVLMAVRRDLEIERLENRVDGTTTISIRAPGEPA